MNTLSRRSFLQSTLGGAIAAPLLAQGTSANPLAREVGITTGSFARHLAAKRVDLLDFPKIMRDELGMKVIDLMTACVPSFEPGYLDRFKNEAEKCGCVITNLKMNLKESDYDSPDATVRAAAIKDFKSKIDAAARLGTRWVRPAPGAKKPDMAIHLASLKEMIDHAKLLKIQVLIENNAWMSSDPDAIPTIVKALPELGVQPDTGNWKSNDIRYAGLAKAFPLAVSCDFKAFTLGADGSHEAYDLKRCFQIGWDAGFRGPWCIEHFNDDVKSLWKEMVMIKEMLKKWMG